MPHEEPADMNVSEPLFRRPVATTLLTIGVALAGLTAYFRLPVPRSAGGFPDDCRLGLDGWASSGNDGEAV